MILWHLGATIAVARYVFRDPRMDLRFLLAGSLLPDLLDKPAALAAWDALQSARLWGHSLLLVSVLMTVVVMATRRGRPRRRWMALVIGVFLHLVLDAIWTAPESLLWPFLGWAFSPHGAAGAGAYLGDVLGSPWYWLQEAAGALYLGWLWRRADLGTATTRRRLYREGVIDVPIGSG
jgi:membrane-bound metal-dependent hydrolase YbcI (DUF457 family)